MGELGLFLLDPQAKQPYCLFNSLTEGSSQVGSPSSPRQQMRGAEDTV